MRRNEIIQIRTERCEIRWDWMIDIRLILELDFSRCIGSEKNLSTRVDTPAVEVMCLEDIGVVEVAHAAAAPVDCVIPGFICHEASEVLYPGVVVVPEEQIDHLVLALL